MDIAFDFPFQPYSIQEKFMKELYLTIENNKLGIFESPTGTGKSLSICCGALQWMKDNNNRVLESIEKEIADLKQEISSSANSGDWLQEEYEKIKKNQVLQTLQSKLDKIKKQKELWNEMKNRVTKQKSNVMNKTLDMYFHKDKNTKVVENKVNLLEDVGHEEDNDLILEEIQEKGDEESDDEIENIEEDDRLKIYISSRTHSQLSQFIGEVKRTIYKDDTRVVTLASRQHFCINPDVNKLKNVNLINERCLDMQKSKTKSTSVGEDGKVLKKTKTNSCSACPYYNQSNITKLKERLLVDIMDMEDLVRCGKELKACPYYASRMALDEAEVVLISHAGIVSSGARSGVSLKLKNNILILDEAHGLTAALENAHSAPVSFKQLSSVKTFLQFYINKYRSRLSSKNLLSLNQMSFVVGKLLSMIKPKSSNAKTEETKIFTLEDFVINAEIDHMNIRPLVEFCRNTRLAPKLHGFSTRYSQQALEKEIDKTTVSKKSNFQAFLSNIAKKKPEIEEKEFENPEKELKKTTQVPTETSAGSGLYAVLDFLDRLCDRSENGRVLTQCGDERGLLKYLLLNPAEHFAEVVQQCRSNNNIENEKPHSCTPDFLKNEVEERLYKYKQETIEGNYQPIPQVYKNMVASFENSGLDLVCKVPSYESVKSSMYRFRNAHAGVQCLRPKLAIKVEIPKKFSNFLLADYADDEIRILVFCTEKAKLLICKSNDFYSDGTFKSCPKPFSQLYVIFGDMGSTTSSTNLMPFIYALMNKRNKKSYEILFSMIKSQIPGWNPKKYKTDYEKAAMSAIKEIFPQVNLKGCYFHYNKAIWDKARKLNITKSQDQKKIREVALSAVLPLLPSHEITNGWKYITRNSTKEEDLKKFRMYMEEQWLREEFIPVWSVYGDQHRTTNFSEAWNHKLNQEVGKKNPNIIHLLNVLVKDSAYFSVCNNIKNTNETPLKKRKKKIVVTDEFILETQLDLLHGNITVGHFLEVLRQ